MNKLGTIPDLFGVLITFSAPFSNRTSRVSVISRVVSPIGQLESSVLVDAAQCKGVSPSLVCALIA